MSHDNECTGPPAEEPDFNEPAFPHNQAVQEYDVAAAGGFEETSATGLHLDLFSDKCSNLAYVVATDIETNEKRRFIQPPTNHFKLFHLYNNELTGGQYIITTDIETGKQQRFIQPSSYFFPD